jgi:hypothetical protein
MDQYFRLLVIDGFGSPASLLAKRAIKPPPSPISLYDAAAGRNASPMRRHLYITHEDRYSLNQKKSAILTLPAGDRSLRPGTVMSAAKPVLLMAEGGRPFHPKQGCFLISRPIERIFPDLRRT